MTGKKMDGYDFFQIIAPLFGLENRPVKRMALLIEEGTLVTLFIEEYAEIHHSEKIKEVFAQVDPVVVVATPDEELALDTTTFQNKQFRTFQPKKAK